MIQIDVLGVGQCEAGSELKLKLVFPGQLNVRQVQRVVSGLRKFLGLTMPDRREQRRAQAAKERARAKAAMRERSPAVLREPAVGEARRRFETTDEVFIDIAKHVGEDYDSLLRISKYHGWQRPIRVQP